jgi:hypothetical protein
VRPGVQSDTEPPLLGGSKEKASSDRMEPQGIRGRQWDRSWLARMSSIDTKKWLYRYVVYFVAMVVFSSVLVAVTATRPSREAVINPSAEANLSDWRVASASGSLSLERANVEDGPRGARTAVEIRGEQSSGKWAMALASLRRPDNFFRPGHTYRMQAYVRDLRASGQSIGLLLANGNFTHRPTAESRYGKYADTSWHLLQRTFVAKAAGHADTALYFELPVGGPSLWQITRASVQEVSLPKPPVFLGSPSKVLSFDGPMGAAPDSRVWTAELGGHGWGNGELQTYTASGSNAQQTGRGELVLTARREEATGPDGITRQYTSARLETIGKLAVQPGSYVEASMRVPTEVGIRPAFWLIGSNFREVGWPACGELDVMEATRRSPAMIRQAMHFPRTSDLSEDAPYGEDAPKGYTSLDSPRDARFHRYGVYFDDQLVQFYVDGKPRLRLTRNEASDRARTWPFGQPQFMVLNLAVGGDPSATTFPVNMTVSQVAVWQGGVPLW